MAKQSIYTFYVRLLGLLGLRPYSHDMNNKTILGLRTCDRNMTSYGGFKWPTSGTVQCSDWNPDLACGGGLHFLPWGEGDGTLLSWGPNAKWLVVKVNSMVSIDQYQAKAHSCEVVFCGDRHSATQYISNNGGHNRCIVGITLNGGDHSSLFGGYLSTLTAGHGSILTAGDYSKLTAGDKSTLTAEDESILTAGDKSILRAGDESILIAGNGSTLIAGDDSTLTAGDASILIAGDRSIIVIRYYVSGCICELTGYVGQDLLPNVEYTNHNGKFVFV